MDFLNYLFETSTKQLVWFVILFAIFSLLAKVSPAVKEQALFRKEFKTDIVYWFTIPLIYGPFYLVFLTIMLGVIYGDDHAASDALLKHGREYFHDWPIWLQCVCILFISDFMQYWIHRIYHKTKLWKWHAIHHMSEEIDWLSQARFHPVNTILSGAPAAFVTLLIGFSPAAFGYLVIFNFFYSALVHANLDWHFGPLRYVLASPVFHRWHHTAPEVAGDMNFAPTFPFLDLMFGSFYMPMDDRPDRHSFGVREAMPKDSFVGQLLWPFKEQK